MAKMFDDVMYHAKALVQVAIEDFDDADCLCGKSLARTFADNVKTVCAEYIAERAQHAAQSELDAMIETSGLSLDDVILTEQENKMMGDAATRINDRAAMFSALGDSLTNAAFADARRNSFPDALVNGWLGEKGKVD